MPFREELKCCAFVPELPNFQVGGLLSVPSVTRRIAEGVGVGPLGLARSAAYAERSNRTEFGRDLELACPHLDEGACSIWLHREAICSTWFCRIDGGEAGKTFWLELRRSLQLLEKTLAAHCVSRVGWTPADPASFYAACTAVVEDLPWERIRVLGGHELRFRRRELRAADAARLRG
jgi:hypothetical protein